VSRIRYQWAAVVALALSLKLASAADFEPCHMHPPATLKEPEPIQFFPTLQDCESANRKVYGGLGLCHCIPDGFMGRDGVDSWRARPWNFETPPERLP
jgi:hypothetical protein